MGFDAGGVSLTTDMVLVLALSIVYAAHVADSVLGVRNRRLNLQTINFGLFNLLLTSLPVPCSVVLFILCIDEVSPQV